MRIVLISDIHGNLPALESFQKELEKEDYDQIWCAGDIVGYYPWPNEVCDWVWENVKYTVMGNHDAVIAGLVSPDIFSSWAYWSIVWTERVLTKENKEKISKLPILLDLKDTFLVHDTPTAPMSMFYITNGYEAEDVLSVVEKPFTVYGHTHIPAIFGFDGKNVYHLEAKGTVELPKGWKFLINPGSIGQPRDGIPLGSYAIWDRKRNTITFKRFDFDKKVVLETLEKEGLPTELGIRLFQGF
jgi:predicted phosphodiesterase